MLIIGVLEWGSVLLGVLAALLWLASARIRILAGRNGTDLTIEASSLRRQSAYGAAAAVMTAATVLLGQVATPLAYRLVGDDERPAAPASAVPGAIQRGALSGQKQRISYYWTVRADCTDMGIPRVRVIDPPRHGQVALENEQDNPNFAASNTSHFACNKQKVPVGVLYYTSAAGFKGSDQVTVEWLDAGGDIGRESFAIDVR